MHKLINDRDDLYKRENRRVKFDLLVCRLVQFSEIDLDEDNATPENLQDISEQWFVASADVEPNSSCLCSQGEVDGEAVKYVTYIKNRFTGYVARVGSSCIEKFGDGNPIQEEVKLIISLMKNHSVRVNLNLAELMEKQKIITQLELALIKEFGGKRKLERDEIDTLSVLKAKIAIEKIPPSVADIAEWIDDFISKNFENPEFISPYDNKKVIVSKRFIDEYRELRKKLLVADASEYEKQTVIRILGAFYSHKLNVTLEPKKERPNLEYCQLDKYQVNQCSADQIIHAAQLKVANYIDSRAKNITEEKETYTVLSVLLDAYQRFNSVTYNIDLLDGIQESIARLELEIEKLPSTMRETFYRVEGELKEDLRQNINVIESDIKQRNDALQQELQQVRDRLFHGVKNTITDSRKLLTEVEAELERLKEETNNLATEHRLNLQKTEKSIWSTINSRNNQINSLAEDLETNKFNTENLGERLDSLEETINSNQYEIRDLRKRIDTLETNSRVNSESIKSNFEALQTVLTSAIEDINSIRGEIVQVKDDSKIKWWAIIIIPLFFSLIVFWTIDTRLKKIEIEQNQRVNPVLRRSF
jgi:predicted  nucleic acid-binding Zn-ribbon protein